MKDTFIIRSEWYPAISKLNDTQKAIILTNLFKFHSDGEVDLSDALVELVWSFIEPNLIRNMANYEDRVKKASENGKKGGRPKSEENQNKGLAFSETNKKPIETLNVSVSDSVSDNVSKDIYRAFSQLSISNQEVEKLLEKYSITQIDAILDDIQNFKGHKKYNSLYLTAAKWLAKNEPKQQEMIYDPLVEKARLHGYIK